MQSSGNIRTGHPARRTAKAKGRHKAVAGTSSQGHIVGLVGIWQKLICIWREEGCHLDGWRLENFRCTENSSSGWQTLEHVAANGAIVVGDISYIIWEIKHTEASGTGTISLVQMFFCSGVETGILNYNNFPMRQNVTSPSCYARQFSQIQRPIRPKSEGIINPHPLKNIHKLFKWNMSSSPKSQYIWRCPKMGVPPNHPYIARSSMIIHPAIGVSPIETSIYSPPKKDAVAWNRLHWRHQHCRGGLDDLREHVDLEKTQLATFGWDIWYKYNVMYIYIYHIILYSTLYLLLYIYYIYNVMSWSVFNMPYCTVICTLKLCY